MPTPSPSRIAKLRALAVDPQRGRPHSQEWWGQRLHATKDTFYAWEKGRRDIDPARWELMLRVVIELVQAQQAGRTLGEAREIVMRELGVYGPPPQPEEGM